MAKTRFIQNNFLSGELSPLLEGNVSLAQYYQGMKTADNVFLIPQGGAKRRAGLAYGAIPLNTLDRDTLLPTMPNGGIPATANDGDSSTSTATTAAIGTTTPYVVAEYDLGASFTNYEIVDVVGISLTVGSSDEFELEGSSNGSTWNSLGGMTLGTTSKDFRFTISSSFRYIRVARNGSTDLGAAVVNIAEFNVLRSSSTLSETKIFGATVENGIDYFIVVTQGNAAFYQYSPGILSLVQYISMPYLSADVPEVRIASIDNVVLFFHEDHPVRRVVSYGGATVGGGASKNPNGSTYLFADDAPFINVPRFDFNDSLSPTPVAEQQDVTFASFSRGMRFQIDVEGILSKQITYGGDATADEQATTEENIRKNLQDMPNFGTTGISVNRVGASQYRITIEGESAGAYDLFSGFNTTGTTAASMTFTKVTTGTARRENIWGPNRGYPRLGAFYNGRLWLGGTRDKPQTLLASKAGSLLDFDIGEGLDDEAIFVTLSARKPPKITDIYAGRNLQITTTSDEFAILEGSTTPATAFPQSQTSNGSLFVPIQEADGASIYCDANGKTLREFVYSFNEDSYVSTDISVLSSHLINTPVATAFLTGTSSDDANWLFIVNQDGTAAVLNKLRSQDINGFVQMSTDGTFKDVAVSGDQAGFVVERTINGSTVRFIELLDFDSKMDASNRSQITGVTVTGFSHLADQSVKVLAGSSVLSDRTVNTNGTITLTTEEATTHNLETLEAGLNFTPRVQTMPINTNVGSGDNFMRLKRITRMNIKVYQTQGISIDGVPVPNRSFGGGFGSASEFTGIIDDWHDINGWDRSTTPVISCADPTPMHIQAIEYEVESS